MSDSEDILSRMSRALGEENSGESERSAATRARILTSLGASRAPSRRRPWVPVLLLLGVGTSAWASQSEGVRSWLSSVTDGVTNEGVASEAPTHAPSKSPRSRTAEARAPQASASASPAAPTHTSPPSGEETRVSGERAPPSALGSGSGAAPRTAVASSAPSPSESEPSSESPSPRSSATRPSDAGLGIYQTAHRAQFSDGDCQAAIEGYGRYLARYPSGTFEPEARYNSALCSLRLGDHGTARAALQPFASGKYGQYRRERALQLLEAIGP